MNKKSVLSVNNLNKVYFSKNSKKINALNNLNLEVNEGEIFGLLGPNGAGKTTFINILGGTVTKSSGKVNVWGFDLDVNPRQVRASIGIVPQEVNLDPFFSPKNLLELHAGLYGIKKKDRITDSILKLVSLENQANSYARSLSGGMKRRLLVAKALVHQPPILFLDEPTAGVDVELRKKLWAYIKKLNSKGTTIILTTHYLEEAEKLCDHIAVINKGKLVACDKKDTLLSLIDIKEIQVKLSQPLLETPKNLKDFIISNNKELLVIRYSKSKISTGKIIERIIGNNLKIEDLSTRDTDLEDIFLKLLDH